MILLCFSPLLVFGAQKKCQISYRVLYAIAKTEGHPKKEVGYPYLISFNNSQDMKSLSKIELDYEELDSRTIDCKNLKSCVLIFQELKKNSITNLDLGAFQINPTYHLYADTHYFKLKDSLLAACEIITKIKNKFGWSWDSLAKYHSYSKERNLQYQKYLKHYAKE